MRFNTHFITHRRISMLSIGVCKQIRELIQESFFGRGWVGDTNQEGVSLKVERGSGRKRSQLIEHFFCLYSFISRYPKWALYCLVYMLSGDHHSLSFFYLTRSSSSAHNAWITHSRMAWWHGSQKTDRQTDSQGREGRLSFAQLHTIIMSSSSVRIFVCLLAALPAWCLLPSSGKLATVGRQTGRQGTGMWRDLRFVNGYYETRKYTLKLSESRGDCSVIMLNALNCNNM